VECNIASLSPLLNSNIQHPALLPFPQPRTSVETRSDENLPLQIRWLSELLVMELIMTPVILHTDTKYDSY
jgi:hypothetical protein